MACFDDLPDELHDIIGLFLSPRARQLEPSERKCAGYLSSLSQTSKRYHGIYNPILYSNISATWVSSRKQLSMILTLLSNPGLAANVNLLCVKLMDIDLLDAEIMTRLMKQLFGQSDNFLTDLWSNVSLAYAMYRLLQSLLEQCRNLKALRVTWDSWRGSKHREMNVTDHKAGFSSMPHLQYLCLDGDLTSTPADLMHYIRAIRNISELRLVDCDFLDFTRTKGNELESIKTLAISSCRMTQQDLSDFLKMCSSLESLSVSVKDPDEFFEDGINIYREWGHVILGLDDVVDAALALATTLKHFEYDSFYEDGLRVEDFLGDMSAFTSLESLKVTAEYVDDDEWNTHQSELAVILPSSLQKLDVRLYRASVLTREMQLLAEDSTILPNLLSIGIYQYDEYSEEHSAEDMISRFEHTARKLVVHYNCLC